MKIKEQGLLPDPADFGRKLRKIRTLMRVTQKEMADRIGITSAAYANWELGKRIPRINHMKVLSDVSGLPLSYFTDPSKDIDLDLELDEQIMDGDQLVPLVNGALLSGDPDLAAVWKQARRYSAEIFRKRDMREYFAFQVDDESMQAASPFDGRTIVKGSVAIIRKAGDPLMQPGDLAGVPAVVSPEGGSAVIREIQWDGSAIILKPWNTEYRPRRCERQDVRLYGEAVRSILTY